MTKRKLFGLISSIFMIITVLSLLAACAQSTPTSAPAPATTAAPAPATSAAPPKTSAPAPATSAAPATKPAPATSAAGGQTWNLRYALDTPQGTPKSDAVGAWAKMVEQATNGRVKVTVFYGATLCSLPDTMTAVQNGIADIGDNQTGIVPGAFPLTEVITLPFLGTGSGVTNGKISWQLNREFPAMQAELKNYKTVGIFCTEAYHLATVKKPVRTLDDLKGLKIRAVGGPPTDMTKALGATPIQISMPDVYLALQKGTLDGTWYSWEAVFGFRMYEVTKYITDIPTSGVVFVVFMNQKTWDSFPSDIKKQIDTVCGEKIAENNGQAFDGSQTALMALLKKGNIAWPAETIKLSADEEAKWTALAGKPIWDGWVKTWSSKGPTQEILDKALKLKGQIK